MSAKDFVPLTGLSSIVLSHPRGGVRRRGEPSIDFGVFVVVCVKESPPSILVTRNPY